MTGSPDSSIAAVLRHASRLLAGIGAGNPRLEAEYLLSHACGLDRIELFRRGREEAVPEGILAHFGGLLARRLSREPLQYVLGTAPFCELELLVGPGVLIPRSETEVLVDQAARAAREGPWVRAARLRPEEPAGEGPAPPAPAEAPLLIDVGTGSGAILLALLHRLPGWRGVGVDCSRGALSWARRNLRRAPSGGRADLLLGSLLDSVRQGGAGMVVSNLPYIRTADLGDLALEIRQHEPRVALDGGEDGLSLVRPLLPEAARVLRSGGLFALELAPDQPEIVRKEARSSGWFEEVRIYQDLADRPRGILARRV